MRRRASSWTCFLTGNAPSAPVPITSRPHRQGMSSAIDSGVCPYPPRSLLDAALLALADLPAVDDQVVIAGHAVDSHRTERVPGESRADAPYPHPDRMAGTSDRPRSGMGSIPVAGRIASSRRPGAGTVSGEPLRPRNSSPDMSVPPCTLRSWPSTVRPARSCGHFGNGRGGRRAAEGVPRWQLGARGPTAAVHGRRLNHDVRPFGPKHPRSRRARRPGITGAPASRRPCAPAGRPRRRLLRRVPGTCIFPVVVAAPVMSPGDALTGKGRVRYSTGLADPQEADQRSPTSSCAQNSQICTALVLIGIEPAPAQNGGNARVLT